jgi:hypothetical protein
VGFFGETYRSKRKGMEMAAREFHVILKNRTGSDLVINRAECDGGEFDLHPNDGAARVSPNSEGQFSSESDGIATGTSGWCRWSVRATDHTEFVQINWSVPFIGKPHITFGVFRSDPDDNFRDNRQPDLEMGVVGWNEADSDDFLGDLPYVGAYTLLIPFSFFSGAEVSTKPRVQFLVRPAGIGIQSSGLQFSSHAPSASDEAGAAFRHRAEAATRLGFPGGFPNFHYADRPAGAQVAGTIFVKSPAAQWRDVPLNELRNAPLSDFGECMRAAHDYAVRHGFVSGFPNFFRAQAGQTMVCGTVLLSSDVAEWRDVSLLELGRPSLDDIGARFRATQDYANRNGFVGGYPNMYHRENGPRQLNASPYCGTILLKREFAEWQDVQTRGPIR